jgi:hypothetical protein
MLQKILLTLSLLISCYYSGYCQSTIKSINLGISRPTGNHYKYWGFGPSIGAHIFYPEYGNIMFGGRIAANGWGSDKDELYKKYNGNLEEINIDTYGLVFEFTPGIRYQLKQIEHKTFFFTQLGFGLYHINFRTSKIFENNLGLNLGMIFIFTIHPMIQPEISLLFHTIFREKDTVNYLSLNTGVLF